MVRLLFDQLEPAGKVDAAGGDKRMVGPQLHSRVTGLAGEGHAFIHERSAEMMPAGPRVNQEDPELRGGLVGGHAEHAPYPLAVHLGDPGRLPRRVVPGRVTGGDLRDECLEGGIPAELSRVYLAVSHHHPAEITRPSEAAYLDPLTAHRASMAGPARLPRCGRPAGQGTETVVSVAE